MRSTHYSSARVTLYRYPVSPESIEVTPFGNHLIKNGAVLGEAPSGIPFDREGWDQTDGRLRSLFVLFVDSPEFLELDIRIANPTQLESLEDFRVKVGLEQLVRESIVATGDGWTIRFRGPKQRLFPLSITKVVLAKPQRP